MGCSVAWKLADAGLKVLVLERSVPGAEASSAAAGILGPAAEAHRDDLALSLGLASRDLHSLQATRLREEHGMEIGHRRCGLLMTAFDEPSLNELRERARFLKRANVPSDLVDSAEAKKLEPALHPEVHGGLLLPSEAQLEPRRLLRGLSLAAERAGATFRSDTTVRRIATADAKVQGVEVEGERLDAPLVIVAAGSWTTQLVGLSLPATAVRPVRGQMVSTQTRPPLFSRIVFGAGGYLVPRPDGSLLCGSTEEAVGFERAVTFRGMSGILARATSLAPSLADAPITGYWSSFRPATPDGLPIIGEMQARGLFVASGHYRNGILLGPITAQIVSRLVLGDSDPTWDALSPRRFLESAS